MKMTSYQNALAVVAVAVFYTNLPQFFDEHTDLVLGDAPKHWVVAFAVISAPLFVSVLNRDLRRWPIIWWCFAFVWMSVVWFFRSSQSEIAWEAVRHHCLTVIVLSVMLVVFASRSATLWARKTMVVAVLLGALLNIYELFYPMTFSRIPGRSAGLYLNANQAGTALVLGMLLSMTVLDNRYRAPFMLLVGVGVLPAVSRQSTLSWLIAVAFAMLASKVSPKDFFMTSLGGIFLAILFLLPRWGDLVSQWESSGVWNKNVEERIFWFTNPSLQPSVYDSASVGRAEVARIAWERFSQHPFLGGGTGASREKWSDSRDGTHNMYLTFLTDHGIVGGAVFPLLTLTAIWRARGETKSTALVFAVLIMFMGFFSHTIMDDVYFLTLFSLMAAMAGESSELKCRNSTESSWTPRHVFQHARRT